MTEEEIKTYIQSLIMRGATYEELGTCKGFAYKIYELAGKPLAPDLYEAEKDFVKLQPGERMQFLDIVVIRQFDLQERHVGIAWDQFSMAHCSVSGNGVAISDLNRYPFTTYKKSIGRHKSML